MPSSVGNVDQHQRFPRPHTNSFCNQSASSKQGQSNDLYVTGLPPEFTVVMIKNLFKKIGEVVYVKILPPRSPEFSPRAGFIRYRTNKEAEKAIQELSGMRLGSYTLMVAFSKHISSKPTEADRYQELLKKLEDGPLSDAEHAGLLVKGTSPIHSERNTFATSHGDYHQELKQSNFKPRDNSSNQSRFSAPLHQKLQNDFASNRENNRPCHDRNFGNRKTPNRPSYSQNAYNHDFGDGPQSNGGFNSSRSNDQPRFEKSRHSGIKQSDFVGKSSKDMFSSNSSKQFVQIVVNDILNDPIEEQAACKVCGTITKTFCAACSSAYYCSEKCQVKDWPQHSLICQSPGKNGKNKDVVLDVAKLPETPSKASVNLIKSPSKEFQVEQIKHKICSFPSIIKPQSEFDVIVTDINPDEAFLVCQVADEALIKSLNQLQAELNAYFSSKKAPLSKPTIGDACAAQYSEDGMWYRSVITQLNDSTQQAQVLFVDYGNSEVVKYNELMHLEAIFCQHPAFAFKCKLAQTEDTKWNEAQLECLRNIFQANEMLLQAHCDKIANEFAFVVFKIENMSVNKKLAQLENKGTVSQIEIDASKAQKTSNNVQYNSIKLNIQSPKQPEKPIAKRQAVKFIKVTTLSKPEIPIDVFDVFISHIDNPGSFYFQLVHDDLVKLNEYLHLLTDHCNAQKERQSYVFECGDACCALFNEDQQWYRAEVVQVLSENQYRVRYFDFGNSAEVTSNQIQPLPTEFSVLSVQAVHAKLYECYSLDADEWKDPAVENFKNLLMTPLKAKVAARSRCELQILLYLDEGKIFNEIFVSEGFARKEQIQGAADVVNSVSTTVSSHLSPVSNQLVKKHDKYHAPLPKFTPVLKRRLKISITCCTGPGMFCCHVINDYLETLCDSIVELTLYGNKAPTPLNSSPCKGSHCAAYFPEEQTWYRAVVLNNNHNDVTVKFVDYGNTEVLSPQEVIALPDNFKELPTLALSCSLANMEPIEGAEWGDRFNEFVTGCIGKELDAMFIGQDGSNFLVHVPYLINLFIKEGVGKFCL